ncbi:DciA family protein [Streptomyces sp. NPDC001709]
MISRGAAGGGRVDLARVMLWRAKEDACRHSFARSAAERYRRARGLTPPVAVGQLLLDTFAWTWTNASPLPEWASVAGDDMARHVYPTAFDRESGTLTLTSSSRAWLTQARILAPHLIPRLNAALGPDTVRLIRVVNKDIPAPSLPASVEAGDTLFRQPAPSAPAPSVQAAFARQTKLLPREPSRPL